MNILVINPGTSSIKFGVFKTENQEVIEVERKTVDFTTETLSAVLAQELGKRDISDTVIGLRVVHGGWKYHQSTRMTDDVREYLESITALAPLHLPLALQTVSEIKTFAPNIPIYAVFDTAFHTSMPAKARYYALPKDITKRFYIQRYGFHGLAYASLLNIYCEELNLEKQAATFIGLQLGSGCSICAVKNGRSVDTSMGFSPLEGLISRTRSGTIDPSIVQFLHEKLQKPYQEILTMLNKESGLKGISGTNGHIQELTAVTNEQNQFALELFTYRILQYIGAYDMILQQKAPLLFSGGISEHARLVWEQVANHEYLGVTLTSITPEALTQPITRISTTESERQMYVVFVNEELEIANGVIDVASIQ